MRATRIHTDGSCHPNPGPGAWAAIIRGPHKSYRKIMSGGELRSTNNRMEMLAVIESLDATNPNPTGITLISDSEYVIRGITQWITGWKKRGWKTADGGDVKNKELWERMDKAVARHGNVTFEWVRGHTGNPLNEECDKIAKKTRQAMVALNIAEYYPEHTIVTQETP